MNYKREAKEYWTLNNIDCVSIPENHDGDSAFGYCDATGVLGSTVLLSIATTEDFLFEAEILEPIAYELFGLSGAF